MSGGLLMVFDGVNVGPQFVAADAGGGLNGQDALGGTLPPLEPLLDRLVADANLFGDWAKPAARFDMVFPKSRFHSAIILQLKIVAMQARK